MPLRRDIVMQCLSLLLLLPRTQLSRLEASETVGFCNSIARGLIFKDPILVSSTSKKEIGFICLVSSEFYIRSSILVLIIIWLLIIISEDIYYRWYVSLLEAAF
jgi:hypothetical protein